MIKKCLELSTSNKENDDGYMFPLVLVVLMVAFIIIALFFEYLQFATLYGQIDQGIERSVIGVATENWQNVYQTAREGYASGLTKEEATDAWTPVLSKDNILKETIDMLDLEIGTDVHGETIYRRMVPNSEGNQEMVYYIKGPATMIATIRDVPSYESGISSVGSGKGLEVEVTYDLFVCWSYIGASPTAEPVKVTRTVIVKYTPQF